MVQRSSDLWISCTWNKNVLSQSCLTLCSPMDYSPPSSSVCEIFQARILDWVAISFTRRSSWPRDQTQVSCIAGRFFTTSATWEVQETRIYYNLSVPLWGKYRDVGSWGPFLCLCFRIISIMLTNFLIPVGEQSWTKSELSSFQSSKPAWPFLAWLYYPSFTLYSS